MQNHQFARLVALVLAVAGHGCSQTPTAPSPVPAASQSVATSTLTPTVASLAISGGVAFSAIGETRQLTATANYSDGTTRNVTTEAQWQSLTPSMFIISSSGVVTVVGFGVASLRAQFGTRISQIQLSATPPDTFAFYGRVREPGMGGIAGARVSEPQSGASTVTDSEGSFSIASLSSGHLVVERDGFEAGQLDARPGIFNDASLQRVIRVTAGETVTPLQLAPHDMSYPVGGDRCFPCRLIRVANPTAGTLHVILNWTGPHMSLNLWAGGQRITGTYPELTTDLAVSAGEAVVYVGMILPASADGATDYVPFKMATSIQPGP
jgi:hypothetical protein